jgi:hypothetical protein
MMFTKVTWLTHDHSMSNFLVFKNKIIMTYLFYFLLTFVYLWYCVNPKLYDDDLQRAASMLRAILPIIWGMVLLEAIVTCTGTEW